MVWVTDDKNTEIIHDEKKILEKVLFMPFSADLVIQFRIYNLKKD